MTAELLKQYAADHAKQVGSGIHSFTEEHKQKNLQLRDKVIDLFPFADLNKTNDCDLVYRFLIARKWDLVAAEKMLREYFIWRKDEKIDEVLWETFDSDIQSAMAAFFGTDKEGQPVLWDEPNPKQFAKLLKTAPRATMMRAHYQLMERARFLSRLCGVDRITYVLDLSSVTMSSVNSDALGMLKEMSGADQRFYPEIMRRMIVCNGGWAVSAAWKVIRPLLDERVQKKIQFLKDPPSVALLAEFVEEREFHPRYVGKPVDTTPNKLRAQLDFATSGKKGVYRTAEPVGAEASKTTSETSSKIGGTAAASPLQPVIAPASPNTQQQQQQRQSQIQQERVQRQLSQPFRSVEEEEEAMLNESDRLEDSSCSSLEDPSDTSTLARHQSAQRSELCEADSDGYYSLPDEEEDDEHVQVTRLNSAVIRAARSEQSAGDRTTAVAGATTHTAAAAAPSPWPSNRRTTPPPPPPPANPSPSSSLTVPPHCNADQPLTPSTAEVLSSSFQGSCYLRSTVTPSRLGDGLAVEMDIHTLGRTIQGYHQGKLIGESQDNLIVSYAVPVGRCRGNGTTSTSSSSSNSIRSSGVSNNSVASSGKVLQVGSSSSRDPHTKFLIGELLRESGHPIHTYLIVTDARRHAKFVLQRRNFHRQIVIYQVIGDTKVSTNKTYDHSVLGERVKMARCGPPPGEESPKGGPLKFLETKLFSPKSGAPTSPASAAAAQVRQQETDWAVWGKVRVGTQEVRRYLAERQGSTILFYDTLASLPIYDLFCLAVGLVELWE